MAYVYPREMRATRDLLRRRCHFMRKRAELLTHIQNTASQYLLPTFAKKLAYHANRLGVGEGEGQPAALRANVVRPACRASTGIQSTLRTPELRDPDASARSGPQTDQRHQLALGSLAGPVRRQALPCPSLSALVTRTKLRRRQLEPQ